MHIQFGGALRIPQLVMGQSATITKSLGDDGCVRPQALPQLAGRQEVAGIKTTAAGIDVMWIMMRSRRGVDQKEVCGAD